MNEASNNSEKLEMRKNNLASSQISKEDKTAKPKLRLILFSIVFGVVGFYCGISSCMIAGLWEEAGLVLAVPALSLMAVTIILVFKLKPKVAAAAIAAAVLFLFLSISLPALHRVRQGAKHVVCQSNLSQIGLAVAAYAKDNDGYLPSADNWCDLLTEYYKELPEELLQCPAAETGRCNYAFNKNLDALRLSDVPEDVVLVFEAYKRRDHRTLDTKGWNLTGTVELLHITSHPSQWCNILFADGRVRGYDVQGLIKDPPRWEP
ncbi:MAG: hypothetical protein ACYSU6_08330 [Planctomycetota bacterium]|jgi:prepilin-type processing-associated H-X9-DG protein